MTNFTITQHFNRSSQELYDAWLDSEKHGSMTGGEADCSNTMGDDFTAWDGYISGKNLELENGKRIVQSWRTVEFKHEDIDSRLEIELIDEEDGCVLTLTHSNIPLGQPDYEKGWEDNYFVPMREFFES